MNILALMIIGLSVFFLLLLIILFYFVITSPDELVPLESDESNGVISGKYAIISIPSDLEKLSDVLIQDNGNTVNFDLIDIFGAKLYSFYGVPVKKRKQSDFSASNEHVKYVTKNMTSGILTLHINSVPQRIGIIKY